MCIKDIIQATFTDDEQFAVSHLFAGICQQGQKAIDDNIEGLRVIAREVLQLDKYDFHDWTGRELWEEDETFDMEEFKREQSNLSQVWEEINTYWADAL